MAMNPSFPFQYPICISVQRGDYVQTITFLLLSVCSKNDKKTFFKYTTSSEEQLISIEIAGFEKNKNQSWGGGGR
jgi:hypothetical protein